VRGRARLTGRSTASGLAWAGLSVVPIAFLGLFFLWPIGSLITRGLSERGAGGFADVVGRGAFWEVAWFTVWQAAASTLLTLAVGLPAAGMVARMRFRGRRIVRALVTVPFVLPTVVVASAFEGVFDRLGLDSGSVRLSHTVWAILLAHLFFNYAVVVRTVGAFWAGLDTRLEEQARMLGAGRWRAWREVTLPRLAPAISAAAAIVYLFSFTSFGIILVLGGPARATIETEIYRFAVIRTDLTTAASLAIVQLVAVVALVLVASHLERRRPGSERATARPARPTRASLIVNIAAMGLILGGPIAVLVERSLAVPGGYSLRNYGALADRVQFLPAPATTALRNSLVFATAATAIAMVVGGAAALVAVHGRSWLAHAFDVGLTLPLGTSAVTIGLGILITLDSPPLDLRTSTLIIPIAHAVIGVPFVIRTLVPVLRRVDDEMREAAAVLGASPVRVMREIDLPVAGRGLAVGAAFAFAVSLGEFGATSFIPRRPETLTAPLALFRLLGVPGEALRGQAMALAVVLMVLTATAVLVIDRLGDATEGSL
jgi:thiamine transport system permease protein